jgi:hypothetical protein
VGAATGVVSLQCAPQPRRLDAHDRIDLRVEAGIAPERLDADRVAFEARGAAAERGYDDVTQERAELGRGAEAFARENAIERRLRLRYNRRDRISV